MSVKSSQMSCLIGSQKEGSKMQKNRSKQTEKPIYRKFELIGQLLKLLQLI